MPSYNVLFSFKNHISFCVNIALVVTFRFLHYHILFWRLYMGWGYCPTNIPQWNQKYKVAFALLDNNDKVVKVFVDEQTDLSTWLKGKPTTYNFDLTMKGVSVGVYNWAIGLVDTTKDNEIGLQMAVTKNLTDSGWVRLLQVTVK